MKLSVNFENLKSSIVLPILILDKASINGDKNIIMHITKDKAEIIGRSSYCLSRTKIKDPEIEDVEDDWWFLLRTKEINNILSVESQSSVYNPSEIDFENVGGMIKVTVHRVSAVEDAKYKINNGVYTLASPLMSDRMKGDLTKDFPAETREVNSDNIVKYLKIFSPLMEKDKPGALGAKLHFMDDWVFNYNLCYAYVRNHLPEEFTNMYIQFGVVAVIQKLCSMANTLQVARDNKLLEIKTEDSEVFIVVPAVNVEYERNLKLFEDNKKSENASKFVINRQLYKDALRCGGMFDSKVKIRFEETSDGWELVADGKDSTQRVPIKEVSGDLTDINYWLVATTDTKMLIGNDAEADPDVDIHLIPSANGRWHMYCTDSTNEWLSYRVVTQN